MYNYVIFVKNKIKCNVVPCCPLSIAVSVCPIPGPMTINGGNTSSLKLYSKYLEYYLKN